MTINPESTNLTFDDEDYDEDYVGAMQEVWATCPGFDGEDMGPSMEEMERARLKRAQRRALMKR
ncbi:MAG: hypothetical protein CVT63_08325 [Candidatus Anoxymicrobium japonicum]|uniref:Uncharacterized protein n=1 Tax=Candidatus Anoxymicrobium japonicum TaxID=2013648 RepID=A0A2N3G2V9_9ACTN|nr:MAG: hypothetical protein CVT63_08325 [Candidatus Anoxymicrobium japonicum]